MPGNGRPQPGCVDGKYGSRRPCLRARAPTDTHQAVVAISSAPPLAATESSVSAAVVCCPGDGPARSDVRSPRPVVHAAVVAAVGEPVAPAGKKRRFTQPKKKVQISQHRRSGGGGLDLTRLAGVAEGAEAGCELGCCLVRPCSAAAGGPGGG